MGTEPFSFGCADVEELGPFHAPQEKVVPSKELYDQPVAQSLGPPALLTLVVQVRME